MNAGFGDLDVLPIDVLSQMVSYLPVKSNLHQISTKFHTLIHTVPGILRYELDTTGDLILFRMAIKVKSCEPSDSNNEILHRLFLKKPMDSFIDVSKQIDISISFLNDIMNSILIQFDIFCIHYDNIDYKKHFEMETFNQMDINDYGILTVDYVKFIIEWNTRFKMIVKHLNFMKVLLNALDKRAVQVLEQLYIAEDLINDANEDLHADIPMVNRMTAMVSFSWGLTDKSVHIMNSFRKNIIKYNHTKELFDVFITEFQQQKERILNNEKILNIKQFILKIKSQVSL